MQARKSLVGVLAVLLTITLAACSERSVQPATSASLQPPPKGGEFDIDWEKPLVEGKVFPTVAQASAGLPFTPVTPRLSDKPTAIQSAPHASAPDLQCLAFAYNLTAFGRVVLVECKTPYPEATLLGQAANADPAWGKNAYTVVSARGHQALLLQGHGIGRLEWIESGVLFDLYGETITPAQVQQLATQI